MRTIAVMLALTVVAAGSAQAQRTERFALRGDRAALHNLAGEVRVEAGSGSEVVVEITRGGRNAGELRLERGTVNEHDAVRVVYPGDRIVYPRLGRGSNSNFQVRRDGTLGGWGAGGGSRRITVVGSGNGTEAWADARVLVPRGRTVAIHQGVGRVTVSNVDGRVRVDTRSAAVATSGTRGTLDVDVGSGSVQVTDARGEVDLDTGSGAVRVSGVRGPRLNVDTGSGSVTGSGIEVETLSVDVGSGAVSLSSVGVGSVDVDTGSGSVRLGLTRDADEVRIDTGSGGVTLNVPSDFGAEVDVDTGSGGITVDVPMSDQRRRRSSLTGRIGDGRGLVKIETGSGGVRIGRN